MPGRSAVEALSSIPLFSACSPKEIKRIARITRTREEAAGTVLTREGHPGEEFFIVAEGKVRVSLRDDSLATLGPGEFFGEMALLDDSPRSATITAETPVRVHTIAAPDFEALLDEVPTVARKLLRGVGRRLRQVENAPVYSIY